MNCLAAFCRNEADYDVLVIGDWWWSECAEHTASMRAGMPDCIIKIETHTPERPGKMAPRDA